MVKITEVSPISVSKLEMVDSERFAYLSEVKRAVKFVLSLQNC